MGSLPKIYKCFTIIILCMITASCSQRPARIVNNYDEFYSKGKSQKSPEIESRTLAKINKTSGMEMEIRPGDNLHNIAKQYHTTIHEIISKNSLKPPYILRVGQKMLIPLPSYHSVVHGDSIYSVSRDYNMNMDSLIRLNNLKAPYSIFTGQKLRIATTSASVERPTKNEENKSDSKKDVVVKNFKSSNKFSWPVKGKVISTFGAKKGGLYNDGINIQASKGARVRASENGTVAYVGNELKGYGNLVIIKHSSSWITAYAHLESLAVKRGETVNKGDSVGTVGMTGNVDSPQLYFGLRKGRDALDPIKYIK